MSRPPDPASTQLAQLTMFVACSSILVYYLLYYTARVGSNAVRHSSAATLYLLLVEFNLNLYAYSLLWKKTI